MPTGFVWDERYMWHDTGHAGGPFPAGGWIEPGEDHAERPPTKRRFRNLLEASGLLDELVPIRPRRATLEEVVRVHTPDYVHHIKELSDARGGDAGDGSTPFGPGSFEIALLAAGGVITAVDAVLDGIIGNCYALVRPPGHHALPHIGMGFCLFGNLAIAAKHAREVRGLARVAIVDWDVHHGNGTQAMFYADPSVLTISLHQDSCFPPASGALEENGEGAAEGFALNIPLPPGSGVGAYMDAFERAVLPALGAFRPDLILVASGLDANGMDPLARQMLHSDAYRALTRLLMTAADVACGGRVVMAHEGGYSAAVVPFCGLAIVETLAGKRTEVEDPFLLPIAGMAGQELQPHQAAVVDRAAALAERVVPG